MKILTIGTKRIITDLKGALVVASWNAVWSWTWEERAYDGSSSRSNNTYDAMRSGKFAVWNPNKSDPSRPTISFPIDVTSKLQFPGAEPMVIINIKLIKQHDRKTQGTFNSQNLWMASKFDGDAWAVEDDRPDSAFTVDVNDKVDVCEITGPEQFKKILRTAKGKYRKLFR